ncbi:hypothetical protein J5X98_23345 [Leptothermofonsia sichuanensis E412]|uniref:hypothetical protein n=1 Tax=Leptothermofonsia sichuanensis TaxID=2917832 RepID=UPI001CA7A9E5|nr:hypothetical protein [Leptothermofonsia sichuanensis]QZZ20176.1 hypothetical protein J5X98_23345 [Leptothermofonsia sichuanensis E412]
MKRRRWLAVPIMVLIAVGTAKAVLSQSVVAITSTSQTVELRGTSGGNRKVGGCAGYISSAPNHIIQVAEDTNLRISLQASGGQPSLLIRNPSGQEFCVPADRYSGGKIDVPGRWTQGNYSVYVGDRDNGQYSYTLRISPN